MVGVEPGRRQIGLEFGRRSDARTRERRRSRPCCRPGFGMSTVSGFQLLGGGQKARMRLVSVAQARRPGSRRRSATDLGVVRHELAPQFRDCRAPHQQIVEIIARRAGQLAEAFHFAHLVPLGEAPRARGVRSSTRCCQIGWRAPIRPFARHAVSSSAFSVSQGGSCGR